MNGLIIDNFAGGGGASTGIEAALGRTIDVAINHDPEAVAMHAVNHPHTHHLCQNVWKADPRKVVADASRRRGSMTPLPVDFAWFSPDCKHFSKAKGSKPVERGIRDLAWVVLHWAKLVRPAVIMLENVEEYRDWGPLIETDDGRLVPCLANKGLTFKRWVREHRKLGYKVEHRELRASDYMTPTIRKRLYVIMRCDGLPVAWPAQSNAKAGAGGLPPWRSAAECINWDTVCPSIFTRKKELAENTLRRIARGVMRYVVNAETPFLVSVAHGDSGGRREYGIDEPLGTVAAGGTSHAVVQPFIAGIDNKSNGDRDVWPADEPLRTTTAENRFAIVQPLIMPLTHHDAERGHPATEPMPTVTGAHRGELALLAPHITKFRTGSDGHPITDPLHTVTANSFIKRAGGAVPLGLVAAFLAQHNSDMVGHDARVPLSTIVGKGCTQGLVAAALSHNYTSNTAGGNGDPREPAKTVTTGGHHALLECGLSDEDRVGAERVAAFLVKYYGTATGAALGEPMHSATSKDRFGLVTVLGLPIVDIGMRMLSPRELFNAQGFPPSYVIDHGPDRKPLTKTAQTRMCGNSVCPPVAEALVRANMASNDDVEVRAAD